MRLVRAGRGLRAQAHGVLGAGDLPVAVVNGPPLAAAGHDVDDGGDAAENERGGEHHDDDATP